MTITRMWSFKLFGRTFVYWRHTRKVRATFKGEAF